MITDPHCPNAMGVGWAEGPVAVANQVMRRFVPGKSISQLTCNPLGSRIARHADANQSSPRVAKNDQAVEHLNEIVRTTKRSSEAMPSA